MVTYRNGRVVVMDTKEFRTKGYLIMKMLWARYPKIEFVEC